VPLPHFTPMPLARLHAPFDHPDWIYELKLDGFRALAYVKARTAKLVSRNGSVLRSFPALTDTSPRALSARTQRHARCHL
jgi:bifunctional non-homologous end joining protein LigD